MSRAAYLRAARRAEVAAEVREMEERRRRHVEQEAELERQGRPASDDSYASPDDSRYRPNPPDPLTVGAARATGETAKAARRRRTITRGQYDERQGRSS